MPTSIYLPAETDNKVKRLCALHEVSPGKLFESLLDGTSDEVIAEKVTTFRDRENAIREGKKSSRKNLLANIKKLTPEQVAAIAAMTS